MKLTNPVHTSSSGLFAGENPLVVEQSFFDDQIELSDGDLPDDTSTGIADAPVSVTSKSDGKQPEPSDDTPKDDQKDQAPSRDTDGKNTPKQTVPATGDSTIPAGVPAALGLLGAGMAAYSVRRTKLENDEIE